ncbi:alpha/beta hydrolase [Brassicibacter mesophilus]|uniref:alpha/beta hydrolase n=1 Tax=Brassicibacter mesophilus TaxID=745119 RepID=UPI003D1F8CC6
MKKIVSFLFILLFIIGIFLFTHNTDINASEREVENLRYEGEVGKVRLSWELDRTKDIKSIEVLRKLSFMNDYRKIADLAVNENMYESEVDPLVEYDFKIRLVFKDGTESLGETISVAGKHERVIMDEVSGRKILIYLPPSYNTSNKRYPVVYMHDGQELFEKSIASYREWKVDETLDELIRAEKVEEMIVVGIYNSSNRTEEYVPYIDPWIITELNVDSSGAKEFSGFVVDNIIPFIDTNYRTIPNRENRAVMGSSFGGLLSLWMGYNYSDTFSMIGAISPSLWVADRQIIKELSTEAKKDLKIWIDLGTTEWENHCREAVDVLIDKGYIYGKDLVYYEVNGGRHNGLSWSERIAYPFIFFRGKEAKEIKSIKTEVQVVSDGTAKGIFNILNPVVEMDNGIKYSLYKFADFSLENEIDGSINDKGFFEFTTNKDLKAMVEYKDYQEKIAISYEDIQDKTNNVE